MSDPQTPTVEMLWEPHEPHGVLGDRFGFADAVSAGRWVATVVHRHWGIRVESCERIVLSDRNALAWLTTSSGELLAKWSVAPARFLRLSQIARLTRWLDGNGLPVSAPLPSADGRLHVEVDQVSLGLQRVIQGDLLDVADQDQVRAAGAILARLHHALADYPLTDELVSSLGRPEPLVARINRWLGAAGAHVPQAGRTTLQRLLRDAPAESPAVQLVHGDFRSSNVLCAGGSIAAVLDLEEARLGPCIDEVARSAVVLGTRFRNWGPVSAEVRATFLSGYQSVRRLTPLEEHWWDVLVLWHALALVPPGEDPTGWGVSALSHVAALAP